MQLPATANMPHTNRPTVTPSLNPPGPPQPITPAERLAVLAELNLLATGHPHQATGNPHPATDHTAQSGCHREMTLVLNFIYSNHLTFYQQLLHYKSTVIDMETARLQYEQHKGVTPKSATQLQRNQQLMHFAHEVAALLELHQQIRLVLGKYYEKNIELSKQIATQQQTIADLERANAAMVAAWEGGV